MMCKIVFKHHPKSGYLVSNDGLSIINPKTLKKLAMPLNAGGYKVVGNYVGNTSGAVHRVVVETFIGEIPKGFHVNHKDGNKWNNHISNLEICTVSENILHAFRMGLNKPRYGADNYISKMSDADVLKMYDLFRGGCSNDEVAKIFSHHSRYISLIRHGKRWDYLYPDEKLPESFDYGYSREVLLRCVELLGQGLTNIEVSKQTGVEKSQVSRMRYRKCCEKFYDWYDRYYLKGYYVPTNYNLTKEDL